MSEQVATQKKNPIKEFFTNPNVGKKFEEVIGEKTRSIQFVSSVMQIASNNAYLQKADPISIYNAALMAATLNLPINQNLGFAYIVPYGDKATFQIGYKGIIQLAQRSGQYKSINVIEVYENQFKSYNYLTEDLDCDFSLEGKGEVVGFVAYFKMINGFEKTTYWSTEKVKAHAKKYSKTFNSGVWKTEFIAMGRKTVLKNMLSMYGILSVEMQTAIAADQAVIKNEEGTNFEYVDHQEVVEDPIQTRLIGMIKDAKTTKELDALKADGNIVWSEETNEFFQERYIELMPAE